jgi:hypothetical protein
MKDARLMTPLARQQYRQHARDVSGGSDRMIPVLRDCVIAATREIHHGKLFQQLLD